MSRRDPEFREHVRRFSVENAVIDTVEAVLRHGRLPDRLERRRTVRFQIVKLPADGPAGLLYFAETCPAARARQHQDRSKEHHDEAEQPASLLLSAARDHIQTAPDRILQAEEAAALSGRQLRERGKIHGLTLSFRTGLVAALLQLYFTVFVKDPDARALHLQVEPALMVHDHDVHRFLRGFAVVFHVGRPPDGLGPRQFTEPDLAPLCRVQAGRIIVRVNGFHFPVGKFHDDVAVEVHEMRFVRHQNDQAVLCEAPQHVHDLQRIGFVKVAGRFVREDDRRILHDRAGDGHALLLPAGQGIRPPQAEFRHPHGGKCRLDAPSDLFFILHPDKPQGVGDVLLHAFLRDQVVVLENVADLTVPERVRILPDVLPVYREAPAGKTVETADGVQERRLPAAAAAENGDHARIRQFQCDLVQHVDRVGLPLIVIFIDFFEADHASSPPLRASRTLVPKSFFTCFLPTRAAITAMPRKISRYCHQ